MVRDIYKSHTFYYIYRVWVAASEDSEVLPSPASATIHTVIGNL
jgi:hypothetical protein